MQWWSLAWFGGILLSPSAAQQSGLVFSSPGNFSIPPVLVTSLFLPQVFLMLFVVYFVVSESLAIKKEGRAYFTLWGNYSQWVFILLTTCTVLVHLSQATLADQQWLRYLSNRRGFTNFYQVAFLSSIFSSLAASLLFLLTVQVRVGWGSSLWGDGALALLCLSPCTALPGEEAACVSAVHFGSLCPPFPWGIRPSVAAGMILQAGVFVLCWGLCF